MKEFANRTAVITGAASGIGLALARRAAREGMRLALADIDEQRLAATAAELRLGGDRLLLARTDVSLEQDVVSLADQAFSRFGGVHLLCNNAGVALSRPVWEHTAADWEWILGVNLRSVAHGIRHFVPRLLEQQGESHVVNTASAAGLLSTPGLGAYNASKHAVVTLSETLYMELAAQKAPVGVSVLCPAWVPTRIHESERVRPGHLANAAPQSAAAASYEARTTHAVQSGRLTADDVANAVFEAVSREQFYIIPHKKILQAVRSRMEDILESRNPTPIG